MTTLLQLGVYSLKSEKILLFSYVTGEGGGGPIIPLYHGRGTRLFVRPRDAISQFANCLIRLQLYRKSETLGTMDLGDIISELERFTVWNSAGL